MKQDILKTQEQSSQALDLFFQDEVQKAIQTELAKHVEVKTRIFLCKEIPSFVFEFETVVV